MNEANEAVASGADLLANVNSRVENMNIGCDQSSERDGGAVRKKNASGRSRIKKKTVQNLSDRPVDGNVEGQRRKAKKLVQPCIKVEKDSLNDTDGCGSHRTTYLDRQLSIEAASSDSIPGFQSAVKSPRTHNKLKTPQSRRKASPSGKEFGSSCEVENQRCANRSGFTNLIADTPDSANVKKTKRRPSKSSPRNLKFEPYIPLFEVQQGLKRGEFIEGALRINPRSYEDAYVTDPEGQMDIYIGGMRDRNRALNGDVVVVQVKPKQEWKVLCEAIKDYQERCSSQNVIDPSYSPSAISPPCKVHTPEKLARRNLPPYGSWDFPGNERLPDTLEILGVDKLAKQFEEMSKEMKRKNRSRRHRQKSRSKKEASDDDNIGESGSQKSSGTSYSHGSSEDYLDKLSPSQQLIESVVPEREEMNDTVSHLDASEPAKRNGCSYHSEGAATSDLSANTNVQSKKWGNLNASDVPNQVQSDNPWVSEETSCNLIVTPDQLLDFEDGNSLQLHSSAFTADGCESDGCKSDIDGVVVVAPDDLSGDDFTDSCSIGSSGGHRIEQLLEDAEFLASQQDAQNNNTDYTMNLVNGDLADDVKYSCEVITANRPAAVVGPALIQCDGNVSVPAVYPENLSLISKDNLVGGGGINECHNINETVVLCPFQENWKQVVETKVPSKESDNVSTKVEKKKKRRTPKKSKMKEKPSAQEQTSATFYGGIDVSTLTVDDVMKDPLWPKFVQKTGKVVCILERKHSRVAAGRIKPLQDSKRWAMFSPNDARLPRILIPLNNCPQGFQERPSDFEKTLFIANIAEWKEESVFPHGHLQTSLGETGEIEPETIGILLENGVDFSDFPDEVIQCLPQDAIWTIPEKELKNRRDFRSECCFTIDPSTARDMDDALSCKFLDNGNFEIGVHIADVSYFVEEDTPLDVFARCRATSVYLVQKVIPMLPRLLCDNLCSLCPGKDRLTVSVVWEISPNCVIQNEWFGRSVINSCIKMSYEHAQDMIQNPEKSWAENEHPPIYGNFSLNDIIQRILWLHELAVQLRGKRFVDGALRLDQTKLQFSLNNETGYPSGFSVYEQKDSNRLIEEFMLLANMSVAHKIYKTFPDVALLRRHPPPITKMMDDVVNACADMGIHLDASNSGALQASLLRYYGEDHVGRTRGLVLTHLCSKPMNCALYFCSGAVEDTKLYHHYALNVPLYTHFTSPIRRYPDIVVHRLLGAALGLSSRPSIFPDEVQQCATHCNEKKYNAKKVSDTSAELFLAVYVRECGPLHTDAMVINVMNHSFDCLVNPVGIVRRVYCDKLPVKKRKFTKARGISCMELVWRDDFVQTIYMFSIVDITLSVSPSDTLKITAALNIPTC